MIFLLLACAGDPLTLDPITCDDTAGNICTIAGVSGVAGLGREDVPATQSYLYLPMDMTFGPDGHLYVVDWNNHRIKVLEDDGTMQTFVGTGGLGDGPEGPGEDASFNHPTDISFGPDGAMYLAAWHNSRIERVDMDTLELSFVCGTGARAFGGDGGPCIEASLDLPSSVSFGPTGNLYIMDMANQRIRCMSPDGIITTYAGTGTAGFAGDGGPATEAEFHATVGQAAYPANKLLIHNDQLYVADTENYRVRVIDLATGIIDTVAGNGVADYAGDGGPATEASLKGPRDIAFGPDGELYIADTDNQCIRRVDGDGTISTVAGQCGRYGYEGDNGPATEALLFEPYGVTTDEAGNLYIADTYNNVLRVVYR